MGDNSNQGGGGGPPADIQSMLAARQSSFQAAQSSAAALAASAASAALSNSDATATQDSTQGTVGLSSPTTIQIVSGTTDALGTSAGQSQGDITASNTGFLSTSATATGSNTATDLPTTFSTSAYSRGSAVSDNGPSASTAIPTPLPTSSGLTSSANLPLGSEKSHHGLSGGSLAAAIILPLIFGLGLLVFLLLWLRRRRRRQADPQNTSQPPFFPAMSMKAHRRTPQSIVAAGPVITDQNNSSYYTGLDTSSRASSGFPDAREASNESATRRLSVGGTTFCEPPPVYLKKAGSMDGPPEYSHALPPTLVLPTEAASGRFDPFDDPESPAGSETSIISPLPTSPVTLNAAGLATPERPDISRTTSNVSINSDAYSDSASVHSARLGRRSVAGPVVVDGTGRRSGDAGNPFGDQDTRDLVSPL